MSLRRCIMTGVRRIHTKAREKTVVTQRTLDGHYFTRCVFTEELLSEEKYANGVPVGTHIEWDSSGNIISHVSYDDNKEKLEK